MSSLGVERKIQHKLKTRKKNKYTKIKIRHKNKKDMTQQQLYNIYTQKRKKTANYTKKKRKEN